MLQGWGGANDFDSERRRPDARAGWCSRWCCENGTFSHYLNGTLIDSGTHTFATDLQKLIIGGEIAGLGESELEVGAALIYDRALTDGRAAAGRGLPAEQVHHRRRPEPAGGGERRQLRHGPGHGADGGRGGGPALQRQRPRGRPVRGDRRSPTSPTTATLTWNADGSFTYTPNAGFFGQDAFIYQVTGGDTAR